jgi:hypothetical protein
LAAAFCVLILSLTFQWIVYQDWLHPTGPLRLIGTLIATILTFILVARWQLLARQRRREMLERLHAIRQMNDRIRNALQAIECVSFLTRPEATGQIRQAVDEIDVALREASVASGSFRQAQGATRQRLV